MLNYDPSQLRMRALYPDPYVNREDYPYPASMDMGAPPSYDARTGPGIGATEPRPVSNPIGFPTGPTNPGQSESAINPDRIRPQGTPGNPDEQEADPSANAMPNKPRPPRPLSTVASDQFIEFLNQYPQREHPSVSHKIGGILASLTGESDRVERALYPEYGRQIADWSTKAKILSEAANFERATNQQILMDEDRNYIAKIRAGELERKTADDLRDAETAKYRAETNRMMVEIRREALSGGKVYYSKDGTAVLVDGRGNAKEFDPKVLEGMTFPEQLQLRQAGAMQLVETRGDIQAAIQAQRDAARLEQIDAQNKANMERDAAKADNPQSASDAATAKKNRIQEYVRQHQEQSDWLVEDPTTGTVTMRPTIHWWDSDIVKKAKQKAIEDFNNYVDRDPNVPGQGAVPGGNQGTVTPGTPTLTPPPTRQPAAPQGGRKTSGTPPPIEQRKVGDIHTFSNGNVGRWNGTGWDAISTGPKK